ncbi:uncharacterized protein MKK02DRAFT_32928 [Dioszegia hungarica]|uniref:Myb-like domain-containing protein n=1 Tax=Dioszegia hungarica TaxID=4972 RepID=A0AA38HAG2_9TREE|nr:uncharacterized protein MKK02DRAFT_32928 [Dioszegia hungarica]KAI9635531.1 hypothetical protein MKK02DRAFT_32928 [Dioszegia hungarica]
MSSSLLTYSSSLTIIIHQLLPLYPFLYSCSVMPIGRRGQSVPATELTEIKPLDQALPSPPPDPSQEDSEPEEAMIEAIPSPPAMEIDPPPEIDSPPPIRNMTRNLRKVPRPSYSLRGSADGSQGSVSPPSSDSDDEDFESPSRQPVNRRMMSSSESDGEGEEDGEEAEAEEAGGSDSSSNSGQASTTPSFNTPRRTRSKVTNPLPTPPDTSPVAPSSSPNRKRRLAPYVEIPVKRRRGEGSSSGTSVGYNTGGFTPEESLKLYLDRRPVVEGGRWGPTAISLNRTAQDCLERFKAMDKIIQEMILAGKV